MSEIEILRLIGCVSLAWMVVATFLATLPIVGANGTRPQLLASASAAGAILCISIVGVVRAFDAAAIDGNATAHITAWVIRGAGTPVGMVYTWAAIKTRTRYGRPYEPHPRPQ